MKKLPNSLERFLRIVLAYGIIYGIRALLNGTAGVDIPLWIVPLISALLNAIAKWIRDKWGIDIQL